MTRKVHLTTLMAIYVGFELKNNTIVKTNDTDASIPRQKEEMKCPACTIRQQIKRLGE